MKKPLLKTILITTLALFSWSNVVNAQTAYMVKDIDPGAGSGLTGNDHFTVANNKLFFTANDGNNGKALWVSDGTAAGTFQCSFGMTGLCQYGTGNIGVAGGSVCFEASTSSAGDEVWASDGTVAGTGLLKDITPGTAGSYPQSFHTINNDVYFVIGSVGNEVLFKSNGTTAGTLYAGSGTGVSYANGIASYNGAVFYGATSSGTVSELRKTTGAAASSTLVKSINATGSNGHLGTLCVSNNILFFTGDDGVNGRELWKSDGTSTGTVLLKDITAGSGSTNFTEMVDVNGTLFLVVNTASTGTELWKTDGTSTGTAIVKDINAGTGSSSPANLINISGTLFFTATDGTGTKLWKSDGTSAGTVIVYSATSTMYIPNKLINVNGTLYFSNSVAIMKSDGTSAGTVQVAAHGGSGLTYINGTLFFCGGYDAINGTELWALQIGAAGVNDLKGDKSPASIYPNPSNGQLFIESTNYKNTTAEIFNIEGALLQSLFLQSAKTTLNIENLPAGIYFVKVKNAEGVTVKKIVKE